MTPNERPPTDHSSTLVSRPRTAAMPSPSVPIIATAKIAMATLASVDIGALRFVALEERVACGPRARSRAGSASTPISAQKNRNGRPRITGSTRFASGIASTNSRNGTVSHSRLRRPW